jgi:hypothetical protein
MNTRQYYTLFTRDEDGKWHPQFGDYSRSVVKDEAEDSYADEVCKIVKHDDTGDAVWIAQAKLNGE